MSLSGGLKYTIIDIESIHSGVNAEAQAHSYVIIDQIAEEILLNLYSLAMFLTDYKKLQTVKSSVLILRLI